mgnify:CR=1 FL=1
MRISFKSIPPCVGKQANPSRFLRARDMVRLSRRDLDFFDLDMSLPRVHT